MNKPRILQILPMYHEEGETILRKGASVIQTNEYDILHLCKLADDVDGIVLRAPAKITKEVIDAAPNLKMISGAGVGLDNIDVDYATKKGIAVLHAPSVNKVSTAEHTVMFIMALSKSVISFNHEMKQGNYQARNVIPTYELKGKSVGLIGFGNIAQEVAKRLALGLEMKVTAWVRNYDYSKQSIARAIGVNLTTNLEEVVKQADFVSLHIPLQKSTEHFFDAKLLSCMKPSAYLINTARGAVVNQEDLYHYVLNEKIAGAALDVFDPEPPAKDLPLLSLPNVLVTPHVAGTTVECNYITATTVAENVIRFFHGEKVEYIANPEVLTRT
ncbi:hydroxyacid dehydrogenase [Ectobacillus sp. sgz5001026]|uniref:hydroxyacid dehydrogenase n=1 Tax=Ectobacillus sp. sgz5001026 TaxID=3242473 RepID=UPI0036D25C94